MHLMEAGMDWVLGSSDAGGESVRVVVVDGTVDVGKDAAWRLAMEVMAVVGAVYAFDWIFHNPSCGVMFQCGCTFNWAGGWAKCNVHDPSTPSCPWCIAPPGTAWTTFLLVRIIAIGSYFAFTRLRHTWQRIARYGGLSNWRSWRELALAASVASCGWALTVITVGAVFFVASPSYPWFFWFTRS
ncbi:uncharacterized protein AMSG_06255 [Thecamonas trahens ATCC 50062]|uniref:Uncharacterized protein n=1 Tax=Thecamonas trahens ATCC 50062 TaxID=461836 RepID=A0A0L0DC83_THETB|nr:hypothetical protein AMSG_06255 [Thecamonas trahens ATCC 50062]KNC49947.1 hypothetical protein AMSG_06255 [Thecamonas trahens ATCC 50062]|eukprot:XP_013757424.1 hypothetical protein AMSG_06255 [Thecamonas trahens ATCC 50062]